MQQHGGRIWAESQLGEGSVFSLTLPLAAEETASAVDAPVSLSAPVLIQPAPASRNRQYVVVAEGDRDLAGVLIAMFERHGAVVYYAPTGAAVIQCCQFVSPDLLVLDPLVPGQDGFAVIEWMRGQARLAHIPVVVYGASEVTAAERQRLSLGPTQFFTKSRISPEQFEQRVMQWLGHLTPGQSTVQSVEHSPRRRMLQE